VRAGARHDEARARRRAHRLARWWPGGVASRVAVIMMLGLFAVLSISTLAYVKDRADATLRLFVASTAQRIATLAALMEDLPQAERERLLPALSSPTLAVALAPARPPRIGRRSPREAAVRRHLTGLGGRAVQIDLIAGSRRQIERLRALTPGARLDLLPSRQKAVISVALADGSWLVTTVSTEFTSLRWATQMALWIVVGGAVVLLFSVWASRRVTAPVTRFAEAAERLGVDFVNAPPLPEQGSAELRRATRAFNQMQDRLRRFVADRTFMLAAISHDLRTALTRLQLRTEFIADAAQRRKAAADLAEMGLMLSETLSFARDEAMGEARDRFDLAALLQTLCDDLADAGQAVSYHGPDRLAFAGMPGAIRRACANLIDNAVRYGAEARVTLAADDVAARVTIADRGPGIAPSLHEKVFEPFFRIEGSRSRETGGTGLGLALARSIVRRHGGDVTLAARGGGGLEVRVVLPRAQGDGA
jgi:signal transduction histidine kinase